MEMPVNQILYDEITKLDYTLIPPGFQGDVREMKIMQENLARLIDHLGEQSAAAQGLNRVITTAAKMRKSPDNTLFLLKDALCNQGDGALIGLLKVGYKRLYLFDPRNKVREVEPLCVLDFFIAQDHQRIGYGRVLFDYMLQALEVHPYELAIDGPSSKMEQFLAKNYGMDDLLRQTNNFAVAAQFFDSVVDISGKSGRNTPAIVSAVGRFAAPKPPSAIANVIHGGAPYYNDPNSGDKSERELEREEEVPAPPSEELPAQQPYDCQEGDWDYEERMGLTKEIAESECEKREETQSVSSERPSTLRVDPPAAPPAFADVPAAGLPSGASTPSFGAGGDSRRDSQLTDKGYFDVKFYHNRLCSWSTETAPTVVGRHTAFKAASEIASIIHGDKNASYHDDVYHGDNWEDRERKQVTPAPSNEDSEEELMGLWDIQEQEMKRKEQSMHRADPPGASSTFAAMPAAGLRSDASTPSFGAGGQDRPW